MHVLFTLFICLFASLPTLADEDTYQAGIRALQESNIEAALTAFTSEHAAGKSFPALYYNWGLAAYHDGKKALAAALWRRALYLEPELSVAQEALEFIDDQLPKSTNLKDLQGWAAFRARVLDRVSLNKFMILTWILTLVAGFLLIRYWGARTRALREETPLPQPPTIGLTIAGLCVLLIFMSATKGLSLLEVRATVIAQSIPLRTGPSENDNPIFDLIEGMDVTVRQVQPPWVLITLNTGASGWVPTQSLFQHTGKKNLW
jgi:hypothetical protein